MQKVIMHHQVTGGVENVDKWIMEQGLSLSDVQIVFMYNPRGSRYMGFYEVEVEDKKK
jgi:hypothetical protein